VSPFCVCKICSNAQYNLKRQNRKEEDKERKKEKKEQSPKVRQWRWNSEVDFHHSTSIKGDKGEFPTLQKQLITSGSILLEGKSGG